MKFVKAMYFSTPSTPPGKAILVMQDDQGWLYLKWLLDQEGIATPFSSVKEIEIAIDEKLTLIREIDC